MTVPHATVDHGDGSAETEVFHLRSDQPHSDGMTPETRQG